MTSVPKLNASTPFLQNVPNSMVSPEWYRVLFSITQILGGGNSVIDTTDFQNLVELDDTLNLSDLVPPLQAQADSIERLAWSADDPAGLATSREALDALLLANLGDIPEQSITESANFINTVTVNTQMDDVYHTVIANANKLVITLPAANAGRVGKDWTVIQGVTGYMDVTRAGSDTLLLPPTYTAVRTTFKGASLVFRCLTPTSWGLV